MRRVTTALLSVILAGAAAVALAADSGQASLRIGVEVTRRCTVTAETTGVRCTRTPGAAEPMFASPTTTAAPVTSTRQISPATRVVTVLF